MAKNLGSRALVAFLATACFLGAGPASAEGFWSGIKDYWWGENSPSNGPTIAAPTAQKAASVPKPIAAPAVVQQTQPASPPALAVLPTAKVVEVACIPEVVKPNCNPPKKAVLKKVVKPANKAVAKVPPKLVETVAKPVVVPDAECTALVPTLFRLMIWQKDAIGLPGVKATIATEVASAPGSYFDAEKLSRKHGKMLREKGTLSVRPHAIVMNLLKANGKTSSLYNGQVTGKITLPVPAGFETGDVIQVVFGEIWQFASPPNDLRIEHGEFRHCRTNMHAIEEM